MNDSLSGLIRRCNSHLLHLGRGIEPTQALPMVVQEVVQK